MALSKYNRKRFYQIKTYPDSTQAIDPLSLRWLRFNSELRGKRVRTHIVQQHEEGRLWSISNKYYKRDDLDWILALVNNILDMIEEPTVGQALAIPSIEVIDGFYQSILAADRKLGIVTVSRDTI